MLDQGRAAVLEEARQWIGTPYHHMGRVKGGGVDCLTFLAEVYHRAGVVGPIETAHYRPDWYLHREEELYLEGLLAHAREVEAPQPADIALFKFGRCFSHAAIVTEWPMLIHAFTAHGVVPVSAESACFLDRRSRTRERRFFSPFADTSLK